MIEESSGAHDHAGGAESTLDGSPVDKRLLESGEPIFRGDSFYGGYLQSFALPGQDQTGVNRPAVEENSTGAAFSDSAAFFGAGEVEFFPEEIEEAEVGGDAEGAGDPVDCDI